MTSNTASAGQARNRSLRVLVITGGHDFEAPEFFAVFDALPGLSWEHAEPPAAWRYLRPERAREFDAIVCYDMQGFEMQPPLPPKLTVPPAPDAAGLRGLLTAGQGLVVLHHAVCSWPAWPTWAQIVGARMNFVASELGGDVWPGSGYTRPEVTHHVSPAAPGHPICAGLQDGFDITDELFLFPVLTDRVTPLLRTDYSQSADSYYSAELAVQGRPFEREGFSHPAGTGLIAWVKAAGISPVAYLQCGHGPAAYANPFYRRMLANAISWAASPAAHEWAAANPVSLD
jgi:hypothetical protein